MTDRAAVLVFAEDPGALDYVRELPSTLSDRGHGALLVTGPEGARYLADGGATFEQLRAGEGPRELLVRVDPSVLVVAPSDEPSSIAYPLIKEAAGLGIETVGVVDFWGTLDQRFRGPGSSPVAFAPDWLFLPDTETRDRFEDLGYPPDRTVIVGHPHFEAVCQWREERLLPDREAFRNDLFGDDLADGDMIVFVAEPTAGRLSHLFRRDADYTLKGRGGGTSRTEIVLEEFLDAAKAAMPDAHRTLRLHPKQDGDALSSYQDEFDVVSHGGSPLPLLLASDLVVGMTSIALVHATLLRRPTLSILPRRAEAEWLPTIRLGLTPCVTTREDLRRVLPERLDAEPVDPAPLEPLPPGALQRMASFLDRRLEAGPE